MSRTATFRLAVVLLAGGILIVALPLMTRFRAKPPAVEAKKTETLVDDSFKLPSGIITEYTLTERSGREFHSKELAGKVHVANFFFSMCRSECPRQTAEVARIEKEFGPRGVYFVSISCDPEHDTPLVLQEYANGFNASRERWLFLTGNFDYTRKVAVEIYQTPLPERLRHTPHLIVVDKWGKTRKRFSWKNPDELKALRELLETTLAETEPPPPEPPIRAASEEDDEDTADAAAAAEPAKEDQQPTEASS